MRQFSKYLWAISFLFWLNAGTIAQNCDLHFQGQIIDEGTREGLPFATIFIEEIKSGTAANENGEFKLDGICPGVYHIRIDHVGCASLLLFIELKSDTIIEIKMKHHAELIDEVTIHGKTAGIAAQSGQTILRDALTKEANTNLATILEQISGVSSLKNGSGIAKPVIHGLTGDRITILNNGIAQAGQQWGNDHAPEIDPFVADHIAVIKGAAALAYSGNSLGSVILVEPGSIPNEPHLHGTVNYIFDLNGRGQTLNAKLERGEKAFSWRISGTGKWFGDRKSADYLLRNTGAREANLAIQLQKSYSLNNRSKLYYSYFNTEIGILRGSHISNLSDLEDAIGKEEPFFTKESFSYQIDAPRQMVDHHLLKYEHEYFFTNDAILHFVSGTQLNQRLEFDIRRSGRSAMPSLSIFQWDQFLESYYQLSVGSSGTWKSGFQFNVRDNTNNPETGVLPLIPDFRRFQYSLYSILNKATDLFGHEIGLRIDFQDLEVLSISRSLPREIVHTDHQFYLLSASAGGFYQVSDGFKVKLNLGFVQRPPGVHELYSIGLHQGVSGIEEGDPNLLPERSIKTIGSMQYKFRNKVFLELVGYHQQVKKFIYLQVQPEYQLTVQGAFPVFHYEQSDANLYGLDFLGSYEMMSRVKWLGKFEYIIGTNAEEELPLANIPPPSVQNSLQWFFKSRKLFIDPSLKFGARYVFRQSNYREGQDLLPPPDAYFLADIAFETQINLGSHRLKFFAGMDNIFNSKYRNYLNRLRYFADDQGRNIVVGLQLNY